jgi:hypothetical protein
VRLPNQHDLMKSETHESEITRDKMLFHGTAPTFQGVNYCITIRAFGSAVGQRRRLFAVGASGYHIRWNGGMGKSVW